MEDIGIFTRGIYSQEALPIEYVRKGPDQMPPDEPYASYRGRDGSPPKEIIWVLAAEPGSPAPEPTPVKGTDQLEYMKGNAAEALVAATAVALMDAGRAGTALQAVYAKTPADRVARMSVGVAVYRAFVAASDQRAAAAASQASWIETHIAIGTTRQQAYALLRSQAVVAFNMAYVTVKGESVKHTSTGNSFTRCEYANTLPSQSTGFRE